MSEAQIAITSGAQLREHQAKRDMAEARRIADVIDQMSTPKGRRYVWNIIKNLGYQEQITEANATVYGRVAKQAVAISMVKEMKHRCRDLFYQMEIENDGLGGE